jgi:CDP-paratose 2-epimerase
VAAFDHIQQARGEAFNIGGGIDNSMSLLELFQMLEAKLGTTLKYRCLPWRQSDQKFFVADNRKAERLLDWSPKVTRDEGINSVIDWEMSQRS